MVKIDGALLVTKPATRTEALTKCGFCGTGNCAACPGATRGMQLPTPKIWPCSCKVCGGGEKLRCLDCKSATPGEISPSSWACFDQDACNSRRTAKLRANPAYQLMNRIEESRNMARVANNKVAQKAAVQPPRAPRSGVCLVTGEPTKGGLFKPGMDAKYVSDRVKEVIGREVGAVAQRKRLKADGVSDALQAKFEKALNLAQTKAASAPAKPAAKKAAASARKKAAAKPAPADDEDESTDDGGDF